MEWAYVRMIFSKRSGDEIMVNILYAIFDKLVLSFGLVEPDLFGLLPMHHAKMVQNYSKLVASTIADMDSEPAVFADVEDAFTGAGLQADCELTRQTGDKGRDGAVPKVGTRAD